MPGALACLDEALRPDDQRYWIERHLEGERIVWLRVEQKRDVAIAGASRLRNDLWEEAAH